MRQVIQIFDRENRPALAWSIGLAVFSYFIFISQHILGNHALRLPWLHKSEQIGNGRWLGPLVGHLHYDADVPVLMPVFGIVLCALSIFMAAVGWKLTRGKLENFLVFATALIFPMNLAFFYYSFMTPLFFLSNVFAAAAILVLTKPNLWRLGLGSVLILLMLASYQAAVSVYGVLTFAWIISHLMRTRESKFGNKLKHQAVVLISRVTAAVIGGIAYVISLKMLNVPDSQSLEFHSISDAIIRLRSVVLSAFEHLVSTQPDMLAPLKFALLGLLVLAIVGSVIYLRRTPLRALIVFVLWLLAIIATKAIFLISDPAGSLYEYRYNAALGFLHAFSFAVLCFLARPSRIGKGALLVASVFVLSTMSQANLVRQSILKRGESHDLAIANRILTRIEQLEDFDPTQTYDLIRIGRYSTFRYNLFRQGDWKIDRAGDGHMDFGELTDRWVDEDVFRLLGARIRFAQTSTDPQYATKYAEIRSSDIFDNRAPWPDESSVFISGNKIIVFMERPTQRPPESRSEIAIQEGKELTAQFTAGQWRSVNGHAASFELRNNSVKFSAGQSGISVDALKASQGERFRLVIDGHVVNSGQNGVPLSFACGPIFLDTAGNVVGWWSSKAGREAVESADANGAFTYTHEVSTPASAESAHIAFHGPYSPDGVPSDGTIQISNARLERLNKPAD